MKILCAKQRQLARARNKAGFTLTEMLVTMLILVLASSLLATGIPVAIDTYQKTVKSANSQVALSTTITALRRELSLASYVTVQSNKIYYVSREEGCVLSIQNSEAAFNDPNGCRGLTKQYYKGVLDEKTNVNTLVADGDPVELISNAAVTQDLFVKYDSATKVDDSSSKACKSVGLANLHVEDATPNNLASLSDFQILTRFED